MAIHVCDFKDDVGTYFPNALTVRIDGADAGRCAWSCGVRAAAYRCRRRQGGRGQCASSRSVASASGRESGFWNDGSLCGYVQEAFLFVFSFAIMLA